MPQTNAPPSQSISQQTPQQQSQYNTIKEEVVPSHQSMQLCARFRATVGRKLYIKYSRLYTNICKKNVCYMLYS